MLQQFNPFGVDGSSVRSSQVSPGAIHVKPLRGFFAPKNHLCFQTVHILCKSKGLCFPRQVYRIKKSEGLECDLPPAKPGVNDALRSGTPSGFNTSSR